MSFTNNPPSEAKVSTQSSTTNLGMILGVAVAVVTLAGLIVLIALGKIDQTAGLALIGTIAGVHGGAAVANTSNK